MSCLSVRALNSAIFCAELNLFEAIDLSDKPSTVILDELMRCVLVNMGVNRVQPRMIVWRNLLGLNCGQVITPRFPMAQQRHDPSSSQIAASCCGPRKRSGSSAEKVWAIAPFGHLTRRRVGS